MNRLDRGNEVFMWGGKTFLLHQLFRFAPARGLNKSHNKSSTSVTFNPEKVEKENFHKARSGGLPEPSIIILQQLVNFPIFSPHSSLLIEGSLKDKIDFRLCMHEFKGHEIDERVARRKQFEWYSGIRFPKAAQTYAAEYEVSQIEVWGNYGD